MQVSKHSTYKQPNMMLEANANVNWAERRKHVRQKSNELNKAQAKIE